MQLGTRWAAGTDAPASVPAALRPAISQVEASADPLTGSWTLTWLEGRPIAEWDGGWEVFLGADDEVVARPFED
ncbi:hypothetical protein JOD62_002702 [Microbacterium keratanolyticum]|uniref:Uncharacterized protein n=1 Tax=Microbacterium keratanolyticum TaxID=67574 RepID=A0A9W6HSR0_9MICO|nr:hypothetical protein [Microbacterium keratanolyticum]MBM7470154.1 hypothetical protein [Microbacterium keratanolyticum]GLK02233.1 hypothetical protein GCM10017596_19480 [Microbacterium keratanolyticum]